jgi:hypothetical protein
MTALPQMTGLPQETFSLPIAVHGDGCGCSQ